MKNPIKIEPYPFFIISLFLLAACFSCVKEEDIIIENEPEIISQVGETIQITGIVKSISGFAVPQASIKLFFEELELETQSNDSGIWSLEVPKTLTEGYIVGHKTSYSKSIQRYARTQNNDMKELYLAEDPNISELDLSLNMNSLKIVLGKLVDQEANPISDVNLFLFGFTDDAQLESVFSGYQPSNLDGTFEFVFENNDFTSSSLFGLATNGCNEDIEIPLDNVALFEDLGDILVPTENFSVFQATIESDGSICYDDVTTLSYYIANTPKQINFNQELGETIIEYCPEENSAFYVGVESNDNTYFNGTFFTEPEIEEKYTLDICIPNSNNFLELTINGHKTLYEENIAFVGDQTINSQNPNTPISFSVRRSFASFEHGSDVPRYEIGEFRSLTLLGDTEVDFNNIDSVSLFNYVNIVQDDEDYFSGIGHIKATSKMGSEADIKMRFRVTK